MVVVLAGGVGVWWQFFRDDAPPPVDIATAAETLDEQGGNSADPRLADVQGTWGVTASIGSFDEGTGTFAGYRIQEELADIGGKTATGRTPNVTGSLTIDGDEVTDASFEVDMTTLVSDDFRRDVRLKTLGLQTDAHPTATFALTEPFALPEGTATGETLRFAVTGDLTLHGVTRSVRLDVDAELGDNTIALVGSAPIVLADYGIEKPLGTLVLSIADEGTFEFQVFLTRD